VTVKTKKLIKIMAQVVTASGIVKELQEFTEIINIIAEAD